MARINLPPLTRAFLAILVLLTGLNSILQPTPSALSWFVRTGHGSPFLSLVPGHSFKYPWTLVTAAFVEQNIFGLIGTALTVYFGGRYLERAWGFVEFAKFILIVCTIPNVLCFGLYIMLYGASGSSRALNTTISGGIAIQSAFLVAFKQLVPEHTVSILRGIIRMRVKHFPAVFLLANTISGLLLGTETALFLAWFAFFTSWTYLRFYRASPLLSSATGGEGPTVRGDASDTFAFAFFFPEPIHTPLTHISNQFYNLLVALKVCTPFSDDDVDAGNEQAMARAEGGLPTLMTSRGGSGRREEAERRRALALKALDQRLHAATSRTPSASAAAVSAPASSVENEPATSATSASQQAQN